MATISFDEKVVVKNRRTSRKVIKELEEKKPVVIRSYSKSSTCSVSETVDNANKWILL